jgi:hypothetical protein
MEKLVEMDKLMGIQPLRKQLIMRHEFDDFTNMKTEVKNIQRNFSKATLCFLLAILFTIGWISGASIMTSDIDWNIFYEYLAFWNLLLSCFTIVALCAGLMYYGSLVDKLNYVQDTINHHVQLSVPDDIHPAFKLAISDGAAAVMHHHLSFYLDNIAEFELLFKRLEQTTYNKTDNTWRDNPFYHTYAEQNTGVKIKLASSVQ